MQYSPLTVLSFWILKNCLVCAVKWVPNWSESIRWGSSSECDGFCLMIGGFGGPQECCSSSLFSYICHKPFSILRVPHTVTSEMELCKKNHLSKIRTSKNKGHRLQWFDSKLYTNKSWSHCKIEHISFLISLMVRSTLIGVSGSDIQKVAPTVEFHALRGSVSEALLGSGSLTLHYQIIYIFIDHPFMTW